MAGSVSPLASTGLGRVHPRALAGWEGQKPSVLEVRRAGGRGELVSSRAGKAEDDGSPVKSPGRAAPKLGFLYAFENRVNRLLTSTSIKDARQEALRVFSKNESSIPWTSARTRKRSTGT